jgi:hypothetical protein
VSYCPIAGCGGNALPVATVQVFPQNILTVGGALYSEVYALGDDGLIQTCPVESLPGCTPSNLFSRGPTGLGLAADDANAYWTDYDDYDRSSGSLLECARVGCDDSPTVLASGVDDIGSLVADGANVYFTTGQDGPSVTLQRCATAGCNNAPTVLVEGVTGFERRWMYPGGL